MSVETIKARVPSNDDGPELAAQFDYDFGDSVAEAVERFGEAQVLSGFIRSARVQAQSRIREELRAGKTPEEVSEYMTNTWEPGSKADPITSVVNKFSTMSKEEQAAFIKKLQEKTG